MKSCIYLSADGWDKTNLKIGLFRIITALTFGFIYFAYSNNGIKWLFLWSLWVLYTAAWIPLQGRHLKENPNLWTYFFIIADVFLLLLFSIIECDVLNNYSAILIIPLFQYLLRYGRKTAFIYVIVSAAAIVSICLIKYQIHPFNHIMVIIIMLLITCNEGLLVQENKDLRNQFFNLSIYDELTGLHNYRFLTQIYKREISRANRYGLPLTVLLVDVDHFKKVNDSYGHENGNDVLKRIAEIIMESVREADIPARYGGEEFVILLPETDQKYGYQVAERIRQKVAGHIFFFGGVTVSVGLASHNTANQSQDDLLSRADMAMYSAKKNGRNRVVAESSY